MSLFTKSSLTSFIFMLFVYFVSMGLYYYQTNIIILEETEKKIKGTLLSQHALAKLISDTQKPEIYRLQKLEVINKDYFSPELLSSSYLAKELNKYANIERETKGLMPLLFKYAAVNPTNPDNRADFYELSVLEKIQSGKTKTYKEHIVEEGKNYLYYAIAGQVVEQKCLLCHGDPKEAPKDFIKQYGSENGFGWKVGDLSSIISIKAPLDNIYKKSHEKFIFASIIIFFLFILMFIIAEYFKKLFAKKERQLQKTHAAKQRQEEKTKHLENSLENLYEHVISSKFDIHGKIIEVSDALSQLSGYKKEELVGKSFCYFKHPDMSETIFQDIWKILMEGRRWCGEVQNLTKEGKTFWVDADITPLKDDHNITYAYESIMRSITIKKSLEADINIDPLTKLLNRRSFEDSFKKERLRAQRDHKIFALLMIDIDYFKQYNDTYGHQKGDLALQHVALSLEKSFQRSSDIIFRLGGEEFAVLTSENSMKRIIDSANYACANLYKERIEHSESQTAKNLTFSIGIALVTKKSKANLDEIYKKSDEALYQAKDRGRNQVYDMEI